MRPLNPAQDDLALDAAVDWRVRHESGRLDEAGRQAFAQWLAAAPQHRHAWERVGGVLAGPLATVRGFQPLGDAVHA
ncbi:MAG: hypothetical protein GAK30_00550 [Paracidovorax wautersii]|uniref:FecR N-terminal domain-containing protein n=1 Tax=Paracidovorax wautersii TaxID=1177982 RepID=A0A7V8FRI4_9BURK|nr:MAG: hypothetical protein GAK30_00550 [Paracidovorax wautersii]